MRTLISADLCSVTASLRGCASLADFVLGFSVTENHLPTPLKLPGAEGLIFGYLKCGKLPPVQATQAKSPATNMQATTRKKDHPG